MFALWRILGVLIVSLAVFKASSTSPKDVNADDLITDAILTIVGLYMTIGLRKDIIIVAVLIVLGLHFRPQNQKLPTPRAGLTELLEFAWNRQGTDCGDPIMNIIQSNLKCCGYNGPKDYKALPKSCCHDEVCNLAENRFVQGCFQKISKLQITGK